MLHWYAKTFILFYFNVVTSTPNRWCHLNTRFSLPVTQNLPRVKRFELIPHPLFHPHIRSAAFLCSLLLVWVWRETASSLLTFLHASAQTLRQQEIIWWLPQDHWRGGGSVLTLKGRTHPPPPPTHVSLFCPHSQTWICVFLIILYVQYRCICPFSLMKTSSGSNHLALDTEGYSNIANLLPWPLSCSKGNFHISSHHKFELSCSKCSAFLFRALWDQSFPSDCISMLTFPENCQSCSKSPSILNGQIKLCLSRAVIYLLRGLRTRFQKIRFGKIMRFNHILNMTHLLRLYYLNLGAL